MKVDVLKRLSQEKSLKIYHYKVILHLLEVNRQNINKIFKDLSSMDIIMKDRVDGKNIYWRLNSNPIFQEKGQLKMEI